MSLNVNELDQSVVVITYEDETVYVTTLSNIEGNPAIQFQDEGNNVGTPGAVNTIDFVGSAVSAGLNNGKLTVNISGGSSATWGAITGTITNQTDLVSLLSGYQLIPTIVSADITAANNNYYIVTATSIITDPTPAQGTGFIVFVRNGTATVGGTAYSTAGTLIRRVYHSGAWANYVYIVADTFSNAATARTNLGATTVGSNIFTVPNPSAIRFLRVNADNSVDLLDAATFLTAIGGGSSGSWLLASGGTATGTNTFAFGSNPWIITSGVTTGTGATAGIQGVFNSLTTGNGLDFGTTSGTSGTVAKFANTGTAAISGSKAIHAVQSGASSLGNTTYAIYAENTRTNNSTNIGIYATASGGSAGNNYAGWFEGSDGTGARTLFVVRNTSSSNLAYSGISIFNDAGIASLSNGFSLTLTSQAGFVEANRAEILNRQNGPMHLGTNNTQALRIDASQNFLFATSGTITASTKVDIRGTGTTTANIIRLANFSNTARYTLNDQGDATLTGKMNVVGTVLSGSSATDNWLNITATFPTILTSDAYGVYKNLTTAGSSSFSIYGTVNALNAGYSGSSGVTSVYNRSDVATSNAGTPVSNGSFGNVGTNSMGFGNSASTRNYGLVAQAGNGILNVGVLGLLTLSGQRTGSQMYGIVGMVRNTGSSSYQVGGYFTLAADNTALPTTLSGALIANNSTQTSDIFKAQDNGTDVVTIADFGNVTFSQTAQTSAWGNALKVNPGAHTGITAENIDNYFNGARALTYTLNGTIATQRYTAFFAPTSISGTVATTTFTHIYNVWVEDLPAAGTNASFTNKWALGVAGAMRLQGNLQIEDTNIVLGTTTGTKIGTSTSQKLSLWNATPDVQPTTGIAAATFVANTSGIANDTATFGGYTMGQVVAALKRIGALA